VIIINSNNIKGGLSGGNQRREQEREDTEGEKDQAHGMYIS
jgi:hypothetical protein